MPSLNYTTRIHNTERIRVNVCEGQVHISREEFTGRMWKGVAGEHIGPLSREHAEQLAQSILAGLKAGY